MTLIIQIQSIALSFIYGIFYSLLFNIFYKFLFQKNKIVNIISNFLFSFFIFGFYFFLLYKVNNGIIHIYFLLSMLVSFLLYNKIFVKLRVKWIKTMDN